MIKDNLLVFSEAQAVTASAASTSVVDTLAAGDAMKPSAIFECLIDTTCLASGGASNVTFELQTATDEAFTTPITLLKTAAIAKATLVAGYKPISAPIPTGAKRYLRAYYTVDTNNLTAGKIDAYIADTSDVKAYY